MSVWVQLALAASLDPLSLEVGVVLSFGIGVRPGEGASCEWERMSAVLSTRDRFLSCKRHV